MRKSIVLIVVIFIFFIKFVAAAGTETKIIRVGLVLEQPVLQLTVNPTDQLFDFNGNVEKPIANSESLLVFTVVDGMINMGTQPISKGPIRVKPTEQLLNWNSRSYRGEFAITISNGKLNLINILPIEDYLRAVVPKEVIPDWPMASLKAQAIAARTYTIASLNRHGKDIDLCSTTHCQVYGSASAETSTTDRAVMETAGQIMVYNGKIITALYHSSSGGFTEEPTNIWGFASPYLKPVLDWDQNSPHSQWLRSVDWKELQGMTARLYPKIGRLKQIFPESLAENGKIIKITLKGDLGEQVITGENFRNLANLPSSNIQLGLIYGPEPFITLWWSQNSLIPTAIISNTQIPALAGEVINPPWDQPDPWSWLQDKEIIRVLIKGSGLGHRVGLSQWGAKGMAEAGFNERQILEHYFPGISIIDYHDLKLK